MGYSFLFIWLGILYLLENSIGTYWITEENGYYQRQTKRTYALLAFVPIIYYVVTSPMVYGDLSGYIYTMRNLPTQWEGIVSYIQGLKNSQLFWGFWILVRNVFGNGSTTIRFILAMVHALPCIWMFRKYSDDYLLCVYLFVATAFPIGWMMNGVRQFAAAVIIYMATPYMVEKKWQKWILIVLIAALVHQSAIIMLPIIFVCQGKAWNWKTMLMILCAVVATWVFSNITGSVESLLTTTGYSATEYATDDGVHPLRVLVNFSPVALAFYGRKYLDWEDSPFMNLAINMSIANAFIYLVGMVTSGILVGRIPAYTNLYAQILLSNIVVQIFPVNVAKLVKILMVVFYGLYYYVQWA